MAGRALAAGELANEAGVSAQTASAHLARLVEAGLLLVEVQGRHRYYRLAGHEIAEALESIMGLAARTGRLRTRPGPRDAAMRFARVCYDHLAGEAGVLLHDAMLAKGHVVATADGLALSDAGRRDLRAAGVDLAPVDTARRAQCRTCLDWSERRHHLAGALGAALLAHVLEAGWARRDAKSRAILFTPRGQREFQAFLATLACPEPQTSRAI